MDSRTNRAGIAAEELLPQRVADDSHTILSWYIFTVDEAASYFRFHSPAF